jgi:hypothetical protein
MLRFTEPSSDQTPKHSTGTFRECTHYWIPYCLQIIIKTLNAQLNPICILLALLGAHHIFHVSRIGVNNTINNNYNNK